MIANETIRLLILHDSRTEAERLISMLNNAGRSTRAQHVESEEALVKLLQEQPWDLLIAHQQAAGLTPLTAIRQIQRLNKDVATIIQAEEDDDMIGSQAVVEGLKLGACDVVLTDDDQHLLLVITRELENRLQRNFRRRAERKLNEAERRSQLLLNSSRDAIAFVQDGMYLYANQSFAECFDYDDRDDIECMPVIDMVSDTDQDKIKQFLKDFSLKGDDAESSQISFQGLLQNGEHRTLNVEVANAFYDEEPCVEFIIRANSVDNEQLQAELQKIKDQDVATGLYNRQYIVERVQQEVDKAAATEESSALLYIEIDHLVDEIREQLGVGTSEAVLVDIAHKLHALCGEQQLLARFSDEAFMLLSPATRADEAIRQAKILCKEIEQHIVDIDGHTRHATVSIGIALINETSSNADAALGQAVSAHGDFQEGGKEGPASNGFKLFEPKLSDSDKASVDIAKAVQNALDKGRFHLLFQPIISLRGVEEEHYEVLLRMLDENDESTSPTTFLSAAADIGATTKIDRWVILEGIKLLSEHQAKGNKTKLIINLSRESVADPSLLPWLGVAFNAAKLPADSLIFQLNESDVTSQLNVAKAFLDGLKELGSLSSISNFGCSLNPFRTLQHIHCEHVKVHGSFTQDIQDHNESPEALSNLIKELMTHDKITIVPFVENASVLSTLWQTGVHYIQGHYLQAPTSSMDYDFNMDG